MSDKPLSSAERSLEAGKLHFKNFTSTPLWMLLASIFSLNMKLMLMQSPNIAGRVFHGITFSSKNLGERAVRITMENTDYPLEHFQGFFEAWIAFARLSGFVEAFKRSDTIYEYLITWNESHIKIVAR